MCSLRVCASAPRTPSPSRVGIPIAPVKLPSEPPPALPCGSSTPIAFATPRAFSYSARLPHRPRHAAPHFERHVIGGAGKRQHPLDAAIEIGLALGHA